jgi:hypothetical protein
MRLRRSARLPVAYNEKSWKPCGRKLHLVTANQLHRPDMDALKIAMKLERRLAGRESADKSFGSGEATWSARGAGSFKP